MMRLFSLLSCAAPREDIQFHGEARHVEAVRSTLPSDVAARVKWTELAMHLTHVAPTDCGWDLVRFGASRTIAR